MPFNVGVENSNAFRIMEEEDQLSSNTIRSWLTSKVFVGSRVTTIPLRMKTAGRRNGPGS